MVAKSDEDTSKFHPVPLIEFDGSKMRVTDGARKLLVKHDRPICVINCAGKARTGKSYLMNVAALNLSPEELANPNCGFQVSSKHQSCTKGIWFHGEPIAGDEYFRRIGVDDDARRAGKAGQDFDVLVVDTEGIGALDRESGYDMRVLTLALLMTSCFTFNSKGAIDEDALNTVATIVTAAMSIHKKNTDAFSAPSFLWVVRDFGLDLGDLSDDEYLEDATSIKPKMDEKKKNLRKVFRDFFTTRGCRTICAPDRKKLKDLHRHRLSSLDSEFQRDVEEFRRVFPYALEPITLFGKKITGGMLLDLLIKYVDAINANKVPAVRDSWEQVAEQRVRGAIEDGVSAMCEVADRASEGSFQTPTEVLTRCSRAREEARILFETNSLGGASQGGHPSKLWNELQQRLAVEESRAMDGWLSGFVRTFPPVVPLGKGDVETAKANSYGAEPGELVERILETWVNRVDQARDDLLATRIAPNTMDSGLASLLRTILRGHVWSSLPALLAGEGVLSGSVGASKAQIDTEVERAVGTYVELLGDLRKQLGSSEKEKMELERWGKEKARERDTLESECTMLRESLDGVREELEKLSELQARVEVLSEERETLQNELEEGGSRQKGKINELEEILEDERDAAAEEKTRMEERYRSIQEENKKLGATIRSLDEEKARVEQNFERERSSFASRIQILETDRDGQKAQVERLQDSLKEEKRGNREALEEQRVQTQRAYEEKLSFSDKLHQVEMELTRKESSLEVAKDEIETLRSVDMDLQDRQKEIETLKNQLRRAQGEARALRDERSVLIDRNKKTKVEVTRLDGELRKTQLQVRSSGRRSSDEA